MSQVVETPDIDLDSDDTTAPTKPKPTQVDLPWSKQDRAVFTRASETARGAQRKGSATPSVVRAGITQTTLTYPTMFVSVPRAVAALYWHQPWADVLSAAERGSDGLAVVTERPRVWLGLTGDAAPLVPDMAFLAEGQGEWRGRTVLYQQNW